MNDFKTQLQQREFNALKDKRRVILKWATGTGKSKMTIDLVNHALKSFAGKPKILFVVAERAHIQNWKDEMAKWNLKNESTIICYNSLHKYENEHFNIVVYDEGHHCFTEKRLRIIETIEADYVYLLSATLSANKTDIIEDIYGKFTVSEVSLKDAINSEILPEPKVNVIQLKLDDTKATEEIRIGKSKIAPTIKWEDRKRYIYKNEPCIIKCTQKQKYDFFTESMEYWKERYQRSHNEFHHNKWVNLGSQRKRYLGELKTPYVKKLIDLLEGNKRYICFCASVSQCEALGSKNAINSRRRDNQYIIDCFNRKKIDSLYAVGMATEGMNLTDIQVGVIVQLDGKERLFIQKVGRALRADSPIAYIFYYTDTQDVKYLKTAFENIDGKYIRRYEINQLNKL